MAFLGGTFRGMLQPWRTFIAGTKVSTHFTTKNEEESANKAHRPPQYRMIKDDFMPSPPATPVDLSSPVQLPSGTPSLTTCTVVPTTTTSPQVTFDGVTFTANVADYFTLTTPSSPPDSEPELMDYTESSLSRPSSRGWDSVLSEDGFIDPALAEAAITAVQSVPTLALVVNDALQTGSVTPLIKEELKCTIQSKRLSAGKEELRVEMREEVKSKLSPEEEERRRRRRERNKLAAQRCRGRKADRARELTEETEMLEEVNKQLRQEVARLELEIEGLRDMMRRHDKATQCDDNLISQADDTIKKLRNLIKEKPGSKNSRRKAVNDLADT